MTAPPVPAVERPKLLSFGNGLNVAVIGATGGIGGALAEALDRSPAVARVFRLSRSQADSDHCLHLDLDDEASIAAAAAQLHAAAGILHLVLVTTGILHDDSGLQPEKSWRALSGVALDTAFRLNSTGPALVAKHFLPLLPRQGKAAFAALSARVGSIEDNQLGGWHAYRASKAALNMLIKTLSIELARRNPSALCIALHPGTVDTPLSKPFQGGVPGDKLFSPAQAASHLLGAGPPDPSGYRRALRLGRTTHPVLTARGLSAPRRSVRRGPPCQRPGPGSRTGGHG